jgi:hypothetical protein
MAALKKATDLDDELLDQIEAEADLKPLARLPEFKELLKPVNQTDKDK